LEKTVLIGIITHEQGLEKSMDYLDELAFLTMTAGGTVTKTFTQKLNNPNPKTFIGEGKINEIREYIKENNIQTVIFDDELSATQERNISKIFNCKILDRTNLILDIFAQRAKTSYAKTLMQFSNICLKTSPNQKEKHFTLIMEIKV
jgi:GTP-binding protein HflX